MLRIFIIPVLILSCYLSSIAQVEKIIVETYYVSDADDATDTIGGHLEEGSITYRIFVDLLPGSKIISIYGNENHPLVFSSDQPFFNHREEGITFGKDLNKNRLEIGTVALDSYITLGQCSRSFSQGAYFAVPKEKDQDGSVIGGNHNDGGSQQIDGGLLTNVNNQIGIPLTTADGLGFSKVLPDAWIDIGFIDLLTNTDTTIFGSSTHGNTFQRTDVSLKNSGVSGINFEQNEVLIAQLTTKGEIQFEINLEVEIMEGGEVKTIRYVARNETLGADEHFEPLLSYPYECGCTDPDYLEASTTYACTDNSKCQNLIKMGCMDSLACNYDPAANFNIDDICCYIGFCNDLDISVICPDLVPRSEMNPDQIKLYPNPALDELTLDLDFVLHNDIGYSFYDMYGKVVMNGVLRNQERQINVADMLPGYFTLQLRINERLFVLPFVKM